MPLRVECAPAFDYARASHTTSIDIDTSVAAAEPADSPTAPHYMALFDSKEANLKLDLRYIAEHTLDDLPDPEVNLQYLDLEHKGHKGKGVWTEITLKEGQVVTFVLRTPPEVNLPPQAHPTHKTARALGVPYDSALVVHAYSRMTALDKQGLLSRAGRGCIKPPPS